MTKNTAWCGRACAAADIGYEYEVLACKRAIEQGLCECPEMPHKASCHVMALADSLRRQWGVRFPQEIEA